MSQDVFKIEMDEVTEQCKGIISIHYDIIIYVKTEVKHDSNFKQLMYGSM